MNPSMNKSARDMRPWRRVDPSDRKTITTIAIAVSSDTPAIGFWNTPREITSAQIITIMSAMTTEPTH
jgi:hypothetical protein